MTVFGTASLLLSSVKYRRLRCLQTIARPDTVQAEANSSNCKSNGRLAAKDGSVTKSDSADIIFHPSNLSTLVIQPIESALRAVRIKKQGYIPSKKTDLNSLPLQPLQPSIQRVPEAALPGIKRKLLNLITYLRVAPKITNA
jgi:CHAT domain-containing protein